MNFIFWVQNTQSVFLILRYKHKVVNYQMKNVAENFNGLL